jgi:hypothetical protein
MPTVYFFSRLYSCVSPLWPSYISPRQKWDSCEVQFSYSNGEGKSTVKLQLVEARVKDNIEDRYGWREEDDGNDAKYSTDRLEGKLYTVSGERRWEAGASQDTNVIIVKQVSPSTQGFVTAESMSVNLSILLHGSVVLRGAWVRISVIHKLS